LLRATLHAKELSGKRLDRMEDVAELWLALKAAQISGV
jgi:hypothetical protein